MVKKEFKEKYNIDLDKYKPYGPRTQDGYTDETTQELVDGRDYYFLDSDILRFCNGRGWDMPSIISELYYHLCWR